MKRKIFLLEKELCERTCYYMLITDVWTCFYSQYSIFPGDQQCTYIQDFFMLEASFSPIDICRKLFFQFCCPHYCSGYQWNIGSDRQLKAFSAQMHKPAYLLLIVLGHFQKILIICPWASLSYSLANYTDFHALIYLSFL